MISQDPTGPEPMKYAILGEDSSTPEEKLAAFKGVVAWGYLSPHFESGVLYFVDPGLDLETVGAAISGNQTEQVKRWLKAGDLVKIEQLHAIQWAMEAPEFEALVVSPFVLCRPVPG
ncbi:DUF2288 family protein [Luteolibacter marinus]|uniref:DUF2288 family protein n=1 Tax=Luteolibacter marinus TaxID=2776705 RepID=UPI001865C09E|nr:DUF2288 family protein [Luteolibacter marinus]